jgi:iron complex transport system substrate-binding protein
MNVFASPRAKSLGVRKIAEIAAVCLAAVLACARPSHAGAGPAASAAAYPVSLEDDLGRSVVVAREPRRIVSLLPSHTETLFALDRGNRIVGVDDFSDYPAEAARLPKLGGMYDARLESILRLSPDLVIGSEASPATPAMERLGLTMWAGSARTLEDVYRVIRTTGILVGRSVAAEVLAQRLRDDVAAEEHRARALPRVRVYYELDATPYAVGPGSFIGELLAKAGGINVVPDGIGEYPKVSPEVIAAADPEIVLGADLDTVRRRPGWSRTGAVRSRHAHVLTPEERALVVRPGPRLADGLRTLVRLIHPEDNP